MLRRRGHPATATTAPQVTLRNFNFQNLVEQCCDAEVNHVNAHAWILICSTSLLLLYPRIVYQVGGWGPRPYTPNAHAWILICSTSLLLLYPRVVYQVGGWGPRPCTPSAHAWILI